METIGYLSALLIGVSLGLMGAGGSILTVPVLVYLFGMNAVSATTHSLLVVGATSFTGAWKYVVKKELNMATVLSFAIPSLITVFLTRRFLLPAIPDLIIDLPGFVLSRDNAMLALFAVLMLLSSITMIRGGRKELSDSAKPAHPGRLSLQGIVVGLITGLVGAGGGFLIIPALVLLARLPMKQAVGSSLVIVAINSIVGFLGSMSTVSVSWTFVVLFTALSLAGFAAGSRLGRQIPASQMKKGFGWFVLIMGIFILVKELLLK